MNEIQAKPAKARRLAFVAILVVCFGSGIAFHYALSRLRPHESPIHTVRAKEGGWGIMSEGSWPPSSYPSDAFRDIRYEADQILADVIGSDDALGRYIYVLPEFTGYDIVIHEEPDKRQLTDKEHDDLRARIRKRMNELALQHMPPTPEAKATGDLSH